MTDYTKIKTIKKVFDWCIAHYGLSKYYKEYPILIISYSKSRTPHGEFFLEDSEDLSDADEIHIAMYIYNLKSTVEIVKTMIHEYKHYLQNATWLTRYHRTTDYTKNPYEIEAENEAKLSYKQCIKELKL